MNEKAITLPGRDEMTERLIAVDDNSHLQERFYPIILRSAGKELVAGGVVMMFTLAVYDYCQGMPPMMQGLMFLRADDYIDALVDDEEVAGAAKELFAEALNHA